MPWVIGLGLTKGDVYQGLRKVLMNQRFELPYRALADSKLQYSDLGYSNQAKGRQLDRNYWSLDEVTPALEKIAKRTRHPHTSVGIMMRAADKHTLSQGFCMQNLVITVTKTHCAVDVYYRSTEVTQKFLADLVFFRGKLEYMFREFDFEPDVVRFTFANSYLSCLFFPIMAKLDPESTAKYVTDLRDADPHFHKTLSRYAWGLMAPSHTWAYQTMAKMFNYWKANIPHSTELMIQPRLGVNTRVPITGDDDEE